MQLTDLAAVIGSGGVEVAQTGGTQAVSAIIGLKRILTKKFGSAIGIDRLARIVLGDRNLRRLAIDSTRRRKHKPADAGVECGIQQAKSGLDIVTEILARVLDRLTDISVGREVHDTIHTLEYRPQLGFVGNVALHQFESVCEAAVAVHKAVVDNRLIARTPQRARRMTADVARSAHHQ